MLLWLPLLGKHRPGNGSTAGHGGPGGRIAIQVLENYYAGSSRTLGGSGEPNGDVGTIFLAHRESTGDMGSFVNVTELILRGGHDTGALCC